jgi:hypothetical protein
MRKLFFLLPFVLLGIFSSAQQKAIKGIVTAKTDQKPLVGVSVLTKTKATATDTSGNYSIDAAVGEDVTFSYVGMKNFTFKGHHRRAEFEC